MNIEQIVKLLKSDNEEDYTLGYELLIYEYVFEGWCNQILEPYDIKIWINNNAIGLNASHYMYRGGIYTDKTDKFIKNT